MRAASAIRVCTHCLVPKPLDDFKWQKRKLGTYRTSWCRLCLNALALSIMKPRWHELERKAVRGLQRGVRWLNRPIALTDRQKHKRHYNKDPERARASWRRYSKTPKGRKNINHHQSRRRAFMRSTVCTLTRIEWDEIVEIYKRCCAYCKKPLELGGGDLTLDHVIPIVKGGEHSKRNVVPACRSCNSRKSSRDLVVFLDELAAEQEP